VNPEKKIMPDFSGEPFKEPAHPVAQLRRPFVSSRIMENFELRADGA